MKPLIFLSKDIIKNNKLSSEGVLAYVAIRSVCQQDIPLHINSDYLCSLLMSGKDYVENRKLKEKMNRGIQELIDKNMIVSLYRLNKHSFVADCNNLYFKTKKKNEQDIENTELFIKVFIQDIRTIMQINNIQHDKMIVYFLHMVGSVNSRSHVGFTGFDTLANQSNISRQTSYRFNQLLEEENIVCFNTNVTPVKYCINAEVKDIKNFSF